MEQTIYNKARRDKFSIVFDIPKALKDRLLKIPGADCVQDLNSKAINSIQFAIYGTPTPSVRVEAIDAPYAGQTHRHTSYTRPAYSPLTIGMAIDNKFMNYWLLWSWLNLWNDTSSSEFYPGSVNITNSTNIKDYITSFTIFGLDEYNNKIIAFKYKNVIITGLSEIEFSYRNTEEIGCTATFVFDQLDIEMLAPFC